MVDNLDDYDSSMSESASRGDDFDNNAALPISSKEEYSLPDNSKMPAMEEGGTDVEDEADQKDVVGSEFISTNELGEATFPRRPVGSVLVIEVKGKAG